MTGARALLLALALLLPLAPLAAAHGGDEAGVDVATAHGDLLAQLDAARAHLAAGRGGEARAAIDHAGVAYNATFRAPFDAASGLVTPAVLDGLGNARAAVAAGNGTALHLAAVQVARALLAGAFYAFEGLAVSGDLAGADDYFALHAARFHLAGTPQEAAWVEAKGSGGAATPILVARAVGRAHEDAGLFDVHLAEVAVASGSVLPLLVNGTPAARALAAERALEARYSALVLLPQVAARRCAEEADTLAAALGLLAAAGRAADGGSAYSAQRAIERALVGFQGAPRTIAAPLERVPAAYAAAVTNASGNWTVADEVALRDAWMLQEQAHVTLTRYESDLPNATALEDRLDALADLVLARADPAAVASAARALVADLHAMPRAETPCGAPRSLLVPAAVPAKGLTEVRIPVRAEGIPRGEGAFTGGGYEMAVTFQPTLLRDPRVEIVWGTGFADLAGAAGGSFRFSATAVEDAAHEQVVAYLVFTVAEDAHGTTPVTVTPVGFLDGNGRPLSVRPVTYTVDFEREPTRVDTGGGGPSLVPGVGAVGALAVLGVAGLLLRRRR